MPISAFDLFKIGIGPSSSHTVGSMRAAYCFVQGLMADNLLDRVARVKVELFGSLGATGRGRGSPKAVMLGLEGDTPEQVAVDSIAARVGGISLWDSSAPFIVFRTLLWLVFQSTKNSRASPTIASVAVAVTMMG